MASEAELLALASACEQATGPARSMDGAITKALGEYPCWATVQSERQPELFTDGKPGLRAREWLCPKFTTSLDAVMTLINSTFDHIEVCPPRGEYTGWTVHIIPPGRGLANTRTGYAQSYPLALCSAALKARAATMGGSND